MFAAMTSPPRMLLRRTLLPLVACCAVDACARPSAVVATPPYVPPPPALAVPIQPVDAGATVIDAARADSASNAREDDPALAIEDAAVVRRGHCFVRTVEGYPCHGAPLPAPPEPVRIEVCDGCRTDADCRGARGGRCVVVPGNTCAPPLRACRHPRDACSRCEGRPTFDAAGCVNDGAGHAVCARLGAPPPAARR